MDLMEEVVVGPSLSTAVFFVGYMEDLVPGLTALDSSAVVLIDFHCERIKTLKICRTVLGGLGQFLGSHLALACTCR